MQQIQHVALAQRSRCGGGMGHRFDGPIPRITVDAARQVCERNERLVAGLRRQMRRVVDDMDELSRRIAAAHREMVESRKLYFEQLDIQVDPAVVPGASWTPIDRFPGGAGDAAYEVVVQWDGVRDNALAEGVHVRVITVDSACLGCGALVSMGRFGRVLPLVLTGLPDASDCDIEWVEAGAVITHFRAVAGVQGLQADGGVHGGA